MVVLSTHSHMVYVNGILVELSMRCLGKYIGCIYVWYHVCADGVLFMTEGPEELQVMFAIAQPSIYSSSPENPSCV